MLLLMTVFTSLKEDASELCSWARCTAALSAGPPPSREKAREAPAAGSRAGPHRPLHRFDHGRHSAGPGRGERAEARGGGMGRRKCGDGEPGDGEASPRHRDRDERRHRGGKGDGQPGGMRRPRPGERPRSGSARIGLPRTG